MNRNGTIVKELGRLAAAGQQADEQHQEQAKLRRDRSFHAPVSLLAV
jgi:hypothetical protein